MACSSAVCVEVQYLYMIGWGVNGKYSHVVSYTLCPFFITYLLTFKWAKLAITLAILKRYFHIEEKPYVSKSHES